MGALTSKPYAFSYRPWELEQASFLDYFDPLLPPARVDFRGPRIVRVLPSGGDWIGDKFRFCHDALSVQRLLSPLLSPFGQSRELSWPHFFSLLQQAARVLVLRRPSPLLLFGPDLELGFLSLLRWVWSRSLPLKDPLLLPPAPALPSADWRSDFFAPHPLSTDSADLLLLLGSNPRVVSPLLNSSLRRLVARGVPAYGFGLSQSQGYPLTSLGPISQFFSLLEGRHPLSQPLLNSRAPLFLLGEELFRLPSFSSLLDLLRRRLPQVRLLPLVSTATSRSLLELGFPLSPRRRSSRSGLLLSLGSFHWSLRTRPAPYSLFLGHHYVPFSSRLPFALIPSQAPFEGGHGRFLDLFGRPREFFLPLTPPAQARNSRDLVRAVLGVDPQLPVSGLSGPLFFRPPFLDFSNFSYPRPPLLSRSDYFGSDPLSFFSPVASLRRRALGRFSNWISRE